MYVFEIDYAGNDPLDFVDFALAQGIQAGIKEGDYEFPIIHLEHECHKTVAEFLKANYDDEIDPTNIDDYGYLMLLNMD